MKASEFITEGFNWSSQHDEEIGRQLSGMIKFNNGLFKSVKQSEYLLGPKSPLGIKKIDSAAQKDMKRFFGIDVDIDDYVVSVSGYMKWSSYGGKGIRPITWEYILIYIWL